jgi:heme oxygenase (staphylobilin-producing)
MIVATNTIRIRSGYVDQVAERFKHLKGVHRSPGFVRMELWAMRGEEYDELKVCTAWESREAFEAWVNSDAFRQAHERPARTDGAGDGKPNGGVMLGSQLTIHEVVFAYPGTSRIM